MKFPSRESIHKVVDILIEWDIKQFSIENWKKRYQDFGIWCLEISRSTNLKVSSGMTKIAIDFGDDNWIIKIPYRTRINYCQEEAINYVRAKKEKVSEFFSPCFYYGIISGIQVYLQRKVIKDDNETSSRCYHWAYSSIEREEDWTDDDYFDEVERYIQEDMTDDDTILAVIPEVSEKFLEFISRNNINDLHQGNFGYLNGKPVIFDYSGY